MTLKIRPSNSKYTNRGGHFSTCFFCLYFPGFLNIRRNSLSAAEYTISRQKSRDVCQQQRMSVLRSHRCPLCIPHFIRFASGVSDPQGCLVSAALSSCSENSTGRCQRWEIEKMMSSTSTLVVPKPRQIICCAGHAQWQPLSNMAKQRISVQGVLRTTELG